MFFLNVLGSYLGIRELSLFFSLCKNAGGNFLESRYSWCHPIKGKVCISVKEEPNE